MPHEIAFPGPVRIGAFDYSIRPFRPEDGVLDDRWGDQSGSALEIRLADAPSARQLQTLIHELLHAAWDAHGITVTKMNEEELVSFAAAAMASILVRNPHLHDTIRLLAEGNPFTKGLPHA